MTTVRGCRLGTPSLAADPLLSEHCLALNTQSDGFDVALLIRAGIVSQPDVSVRETQDQDSLA